MPRNGLPRAGVTLLETLLTVTLIGVFAALAVPTFSPDVHQQLESAAQTVAADLAYARGLAIARDSYYRFSFDTAGDRYTLAHSGANSTLDVLPPDPFRVSGDDPTQRVTELASLPCLTCRLRLSAVQAGALGQGVTDLEFGPLGATTRAEETTIWLSAGEAARERFVPVSVNPVTGLARVGQVQASSPVATP